MKRYNIIDDRGFFWCRNKYLGYWSKFKDKYSIKKRVVYLKFGGFFMLWRMKMNDVNAELKELTLKDG